MKIAIFTFIALTLGLFSADLYAKADSGVDCSLMVAGTARQNCELAQARASADVACKGVSRTIPGAYDNCLKEAHKCRSTNNSEKLGTCLDQAAVLPTEQPQVATQPTAPARAGARQTASAAQTASTGNAQGTGPASSTSQTKPDKSYRPHGAVMQKQFTRLAEQQQRACQERGRCTSNGPSPTQTGG